MMPGTRAEVRVPAPGAGGTYVLRNQAVSTGNNGSADVWPQVDLMQIIWPAPPPALAPLVVQMRPTGLAVLGPRHAELAAMQMQPAPNVPAGCVVGPDEERVIYFVHRTRNRADGGKQEVFGILAGIRQHGASTARFFDKDSNPVPGLDSIDKVWSTIVDQNDPNNAAPAFDTSPYGNICAVKGQPTERWVIENWTGEDHNFHLHQARFTLDIGHIGDKSFFQFPSSTARDDQTLPMDRLIEAIVAPSTSGPNWTAAHHDSVPVPRGEGRCATAPATDKTCLDTAGNILKPDDQECSGLPADATCPRPGIVSIAVTFDRSTQVGEYVYHCHILEHEDLGMMARVRVICPDGGMSCGGRGEQRAQDGGAQHRH